MVGTPTLLRLALGLLLILSVSQCRASLEGVDRLEDCAGLPGPEEAGKHTAWRPTSEIGMNPGFTRCFQWLRLELPPAAESPEMIVEIPYPLLDTVDVFISQQGKIDHQSGGRLKNPADRLPTFRVRLAPTATRILMRVQSEDSMVLPVRILTERAYEAILEMRQFAFGAYYGVIAVMILYNAFLYYFVRDRVYIWYVLTLVVLHGLFQLSLNGFARVALPGLAPWAGKGAIVFFHSAGVIAGLQFCREFLRIPRAAPRWDQLCYPMFAWAALNMVLSFFNLYFVAVLSTSVLGSLAVLYAIASGIAAMRRGFRPARFYLIAWGTLFVGAAIYVVKIFALVDSTGFTEYAFQAGSAFEAALLSIALGDRIANLRQERTQARTEMLVHKRIALLAQTELLNHLSQLDSLKTDIQAIGSGEGSKSLEKLLERTLQTMRKVLNFEHGFIVITDRMRTPYMQSIGEMSANLREQFPRDALYSLIKVPENLFASLNRIIHLSQPLFAGDRSVTEQDGLAHALALSVARLHRAGYALCIPLPYEREFFGYLVVGERPEAPYTQLELELINSFRPSIAMAVRNAVLYEELAFMRGQAEEKAQRLSDFIIDKGEATQHNLKEKELVYISHTMAAVYALIQKFSGKQQPILITGETGTGKELIARTIHEEEHREAPFVAVNCAAVPASLWESEIFGHEKGAFTDAKTMRQGKVELAQDGTLFFDEIGEMPLDLQAKLLRLIQERAFERVGGKETKSAKCRFVFATNRDLAVMQKSGQFREDLFYRISVFQIPLPPLRERREDIPVLVNFFIRKYASELQSSARSIDREAMAELAFYEWPGNIRELENVMLQALVHAKTERITAADLPPQVTRPGAVPAQARSVSEIPSELYDLDRMIRDFSVKVIRQAIAATDGNKQEAARLLGVKRATFYYRLKELGIE